MDPNFITLDIWGIKLVGNGTLGICAVVLIVGALLIVRHFRPKS